MDNPIPIIAVTANAFDDDKNKAFVSGFDQFLSKPIKPFELERIYNSLLLIDYENHTLEFRVVYQPNDRLTSLLIQQTWF